MEISGKEGGRRRRFALLGALILCGLGLSAAADWAAGEDLAPVAAMKAAQGRINNGIVILADRDYFPMLLEHIEQASKRIAITMFVIKTTSSPQNRPAAIVRALIAAQGRGVEVIAILERSDRDPKLTKENQRVGDMLRQGGVAVRYEDPQTTTHAKLVVIDDRYCFVGSHNLTQSALAFNHELSLLVEDAGMARQLSAYMDSLSNGDRK